MDEVLARAGYLLFLGDAIRGAGAVLSGDAQGVFGLMRCTSCKTDLLLHDECKCLWWPQPWSAMAEA